MWSVSTYHDRYWSNILLVFFKAFHKFVPTLEGELLDRINKFKQQKYSKYEHMVRKKKEDKLWVFQITLMIVETTFCVSWRLSATEYIWVLTFYKANFILLYRLCWTVRLLTGLPTNIPLVHSTSVEWCLRLSKSLHFPVILLI